MSVSINMAIKNNSATNLWQCRHFSEVTTVIPLGKYHKRLSSASLPNSSRSPELLHFVHFHIRPNLSLFSLSLSLKETGSHYVALTDLELPM